MRRNVKEVDVQKYCLLVHLLSFEKFETPYFFSGGFLYAKEVKEEAKQIAKLFYDIYGHKDCVANDERVQNADTWAIRQFIELLEEWSNSEEINIRSTSSNEINKEGSRSNYQDVLVQLESDIIDELDLPLTLTFGTSSHEKLFRREALRWIGKMSEKILINISPEYLQNMSESDTLVMVADVRRSQDLMTYGVSPESYKNKMVEFLKKIRTILLENYAIFDQFTGDGFIAYFNEYICNSNEKDYYEMMVDSCKKIQDFSKNFFKDWTKTLRRAPSEEIGLAIGVDSGKVYYRDLDDQFLAIGDACVWATRMSSAGKKGDVILNNIPYQTIAEKTDLSTCKEEVSSETKTGEKFKAFRLIIDKVNYSPKQISTLSEKPIAIK